MNKEQQQIIVNAYKNYWNHFMDEYLEKNKLSEFYRNNLKPYPVEEFIDQCKTDDEFSKKWGLKIEERELSLKERYNMWFNNNYETGMERFFDPNKLPDFDDSYYEPAPTKLITITYNGKTIGSYE